MAGTVAAILIVGLYLFGAFAGAAGFSALQNVWLPEAVRGAVGASPSAVWQSANGWPRVLFVPIVLGCWALYVLLRNQRSARRAALVIAAIAAYAPFLGDLWNELSLLNVLFFLAAPAVCPVVTIALLGPVDADYYNDGIVGFAACGWWTWLVAAVAVIDLRCRFRAGLCGKCGYDVTGIATGVCPECGAAFQPEGLEESSRGQSAAPPPVDGAHSRP